MSAIGLFVPSAFSITNSHSPDPLVQSTATQGESGEADLRWPLTQPPFVIEKSVWPQFELLQQLASGNEAARNEVIAQLKASTASVADWSPEEFVSNNGVMPGPAATKVFRLRQDTFENAFLWRLTGEKGYGERARALLLRFADVFRQWPFHYKDSRFLGSDPKYRLRWDAKGVWGDWYPLDLAHDIPLLRAYELIKPVLTAQEREHIVNDLFVYHKELLDGFSGIGNYHNVLGYHLVALIRFGLLLERPDWIHEAVDAWKAALVRGYTADGVYREVTIDYHLQLTHRLTETVPDLLAGYSDPQDYRHPVSGTRFDRLDLHTRYAPLLARTRQAITLLAKPDGAYLNTNDSWPGRIRLKPGQSAPRGGVLGGAGIAKIGTEKMAVFLKFHGIRGHDHRDALGLSWYANGREVFSETAYRPVKGEFDRKWSGSTASHSTVAIDGQLHFETQQGIPDRFTSFTAKPPVNPGQDPIAAAFAGAARFENQGRLLLWNAEAVEAQAVEVEQPEAYPGKASLFRRTVVLVPYDSGSGYLVDIFRVKGGRQHDYFLRGCLNEPYQWETEHLDLDAATGTEYGFVTLEKKGIVQAPFAASARYGDGSQTRSFHVPLPYGGDGSIMEYFIGSAPAIRRHGKGVFTFLRHRAAKEDLQTTFVWVHEANSGRSQIEKVEARREGEGVIVTIHRNGGVTDTVISNFGEADTARGNGWTLKGRLAYGTDHGGVRNGILLSGVQLLGGARDVHAPAPLHGTVLSTTDGDDGSEPTARLKLKAGHPAVQTSSIRLAHFDLTPKTRVSVPVKKAERDGDEILVTLAYPAGFEIRPRGVVFTSYPGWRITGECHAVLE